MYKYKKCPPDKIINPKTHRCISKTGQVYKTLKKQNMINTTHREDTPPIIYDDFMVSEKKKKCKQGQILNPITRRCISKKGNTYKTLKNRGVFNKTSRSPSKSPPKSPSRSLPIKPPVAIEDQNIVTNLYNLVKSIDINDKDSKVAPCFIRSQLGSSVYILYMINKYKEDCLILSKEGSPHVYYDGLNDSIIYPFKTIKQLKNKIKDCGSRGKRFIILPLTITGIKQEEQDILAHANVIVIDMKNQTLERFEPHGVFTLDTNINLNLNTYLQKLSDNIKYKYIKPFDICPIFYRNDIKIKGGWQYLHEAFGSENKGYCMAYSMMYLNMRLARPDLSPIQITQGLMAEVEFQPKKMENLVINYSVFLNKLMKQFIREHSKYALDCIDRTTCFEDLRESILEQMNSPYIEQFIELTDFYKLENLSMKEVNKILQTYYMYNNFIEKKMIEAAGGNKITFHSKK